MGWALPWPGGGDGDAETRRTCGRGRDPCAPRPAGWKAGGVRRLRGWVWGCDAGGRAALGCKAPPRGLEAAEELGQGSGGRMRMGMERREWVTRHSESRSCKGRAGRQGRGGRGARLSWKGERAGRGGGGNRNRALGSRFLLREAGRGDNRGSELSLHFLTRNGNQSQTPRGPGLGGPERRGGRGCAAASGPGGGAVRRALPRGPCAPPSRPRRVRPRDRAVNFIEINLDVSGHT